MEEVWKREQAAAKEEEKLKDLQKQIAEERAREEMLSVAHAAGVKVRSERLDWMYQGGVGARQEADQRLHGSTDAKLSQQTSAGDQLASQDRGRVGMVTELPSFYAEDTPASANEMWQRLHADPLFAIKQQELASRRSILSNPLKMEAIKSKVGKVRQEYGKDSRERKTYRSGSRDRSRDYERRERRREGSSRERLREREGYERREQRENFPSSHSRERSSHHREKQRRSEHSRSRSPAENKYGMTFADHVPEQVRNSDRSLVAEATRRRLEEARRKEEEEEKRNTDRDRNWKRYHREYRPGRLNEEDRQRRLQQMEAAANDYESQRKDRIAEQIYQESKEEAQQRERREEATNEFLRTATRDTYAQRSGVADAVGRRKAFSQTRQDDARGFTRRGY